MYRINYSSHIRRCTYIHFMSIYHCFVCSTAIEICEISNRRATKRQVNAFYQLSHENHKHKSLYVLNPGIPCRSNTDCRLPLQAQIASAVCQHLSLHWQNYKKKFFLQNNSKLFFCFSQNGPKIHYLRKHDFSKVSVFFQFIY